MASDRGLASDTMHHTMADVLQYNKMCRMDALCINRLQKSSQTDGQFQLCTALHSKEKTVCVQSLLVLRE
jgi:hypothetical protein